MDRLRVLCVLATVFLLIGSPCGIEVGAEPSLPDSVVSDDNVYRYMFSDTPKAEAIMAALRERKKLPEWELDYVEGDLYFNTVRYYKALKYYKRVLDSDKANNDDRLQMELLHRMISCYDCIHNEAKKGEYVEKLMKKAEECDDKAMQSVALFNLGKSIYAQGNHREGAARMEQAAKMMENSDYKYKYDNLRYDYGTLLTYYERDRRNQEALRTLDALQKVVIASTGREGASIDGLDEKEQKTLLGHRAVVYNRVGRTKEADEAFRRFMSLGSPHDKDIYVISPYLIDRKMYDEIFRINNARADFLRQEGDTINYHFNTIYNQLARAYYDTGDFKSAADNYRGLAVLRDSLTKREQCSAMIELAEVYESGEKDKLIQQQHEQERMLWIVVAIITAALAGLVAHYRKIHRRNVSLVRAVKENLHCQEELARKDEECHKQREAISLLEGHIKELEHSNLELSSTVTLLETSEEEREAQQIEQLRHEVVARQLYLTRGITAKAIQEMLGLPSSLFGEKFERHTGKKFSEYINELRMNHAAKLLIEFPNYKIEAIANMCGIESRQHFHRQFSDYFSITPSAFRKGHQSSGSK